MKFKIPRDGAAAEMIGALSLIAIFIAAIAIIALALFSQPPPDKIPAAALDITNESRLIEITHNGGDPIPLADMAINVNSNPVLPGQWICTGCGDDLSLGDILRINYATPPDFPSRVDIILKKGGRDQYVLMTRFLGTMTYTPAPHTPPTTAIPTTTSTGIPLPAAAFIGMPTSGESPLDVVFVDQSTGSPTGWSWTFGDLGTGNTSTLQNPLHTYTAPGTYTVTLNATNAGGSNILTRAGYIVVTAPSGLVDIYMVASRPFYVAPGGTLQFRVTGAWSQIVHGTTTYPLNAGDTVTLVTGTDTTGSIYATSTTINTFSFDDVRLIINGDDKGVATVNSIWVSGYDQLASTLSLDLPSRSAWTRFDADHVTLINDVNNSRIQVFNIRPSEGILNLDNNAATNTFCDGGASSYQITPGPVVPVANFTGSPVTGTRPLVVQFTDTSANIPTSWLWDFGDSSPVNSTGQNPVHTYANAGTYTVRLTAVNAAGSNQVTKAGYITVNTIPRPVAGFTGTPTSGTTPLNVVFTDTSTNTPTSWAWNFGDSGTSILRNPSHQYSSPGTYTVSLTAGNAGGSDTMTRAGYITVNPLQPVASFSGTPRSGTAPLTVAFTDTSTNSPTTWLWDFGDGSTSTLRNPVHEYTGTGTYRVTLTATNSGGSDTDSINNYITVTPFTADFTYTKTWFLVWCIVDFTDTTTGNPSPDTWYWDFGDGSSSTQQNPTHTYWFSDRYSVTLTVSNPAGASGTVTKNIHV